MKTKINTPDFSRGEMNKKDWNNLLHFLNEQKKVDSTKNKKDVKPPVLFKSIASALFKEKTHGRKQVIHEEIIFRKTEGVTIILRCDANMGGELATHSAAIEFQNRNGGKGYIQKIFGLCRQETGPQTYEYIGDVVVGIYPDTSTVINSTEDKKEVKINEEQFA
jgi:hypothetical protein